MAEITGDMKTRPELPPDLAAAEALGRALAGGICLACGERACPGCWQPDMSLIRQKNEHVNLGEDLRRRRKARKITKSHLARQLGVTMETITRCEAGGGTAHLAETMGRIKQILDTAEENADSEAPPPRTRADERRERAQLRDELRSRRRRLGIPVKEIALQVGMSHQAISLWENTRATALHAEAVERIREILDRAEADIPGVLPSPAELSERLANVRTTYRIARAELADRAGISASTITSIETKALPQHYRVVMALTSLLDQICAGPPPPLAPEHGTYGAYRRGCRCKECRKANAQLHREYVARRTQRGKQDPSQIPHGPSGYSVWGCRCEVCAGAEEERNRTNYAAAKARRKTL